MNSIYKRALVPLACAVLLAACGGGDDDSEDVGAPTGAQQYPEGIWEGTAGTTTAARSVFGYIGGGTDGKGGDFYLAKGAAGTSGYDGIYGLLRVNLTSLAATNVTYFSVQDGKFAEGLTIGGSASASVVGGVTDTISANYSNAAGTAAAVAGPTSFKLTRSPLNNYPAQAARIAGSYRGGSVFGGGWVLNVDAAGSVTGTVSGCTITGTIAPRTAAPNAATVSAAYTATFNLSGSEIACPATGTGQTGVAVVKYDSSGTKTGLWVLTRNTSGTANTFVLEGTAVTPSTTPPATTQQSAAGFWKSATTTGVNDLTAVVLPDNSYFFYKRNGSGYDVLYGSLKVALDTSVVSSNDGTYYNNLGSTTTQYTTNVALTGDVRTSTTFRGSYTDPTAANAQTAFSYVPDTANLYASPLPPTVERLHGTYTSAGIGFGGASTTLTIRADTTDPTKTVIAGTSAQGTGTQTAGCTVSGSIAPYSSASTVNLFRVEALAFTGASCPLTGTPFQSGVANAVFDAAGANVTGLRILAAGNAASGVRSTLVFIGAK